MDVKALMTDETGKQIVDAIREKAGLDARVQKLENEKFDKANIAQGTGTAEDKVMSQKATKEEFGKLSEAIAAETNARNNDIEQERNRAVARENEIEELFTMPTQEAVNKWLDEHPESTTTVQDKSLTIDKMVIGTLGYVTPEMFGAVGDGVADDTEAVKAAISYASDNNLDFKGVRNKTYLIRENIVIRNPILLDFCGATIIYIGDSIVDDFIDFGVNSYGGVGGYDFGIINVVIKGNSKCNNVLHISGGKNVRLEWVRVEQPLECGLLIDNSYAKTWEVNARNIFASAKNTTETQQAKYAIKIDSVTDSYFTDLFATNASEAWLYVSGGSNHFVNFHGYAYPREMSVRYGLHVCGDGNVFSGVIIDTPNNIGIYNDASRNVMANINLANFNGNAGERVGIMDKDNNVYRGIRCEDDCDVMIKTNASESLCVSDVLNFKQPAKDFEFERGKFPWRLTYDGSGNAVVKIRNSLGSYDNYINTVTNSITVTFDTPFRTNQDYTVCVEQLTATNGAHPIPYSVVKNPESFVVTFYTESQQYIRVNVIAMPNW